jgi:hypothetical protein
MMPFEETAGRTRTRRVIRGDGMVTVTEPTRWRGEVLTPGRSRFHPSHELVRAHPELFEPAYSRDRPVWVALQRAIEVRIQEARGGSRTRPRAARRGRERWRLR